MRWGLDVENRDKATYNTFVSSSDFGPMWMYEQK